MGRRFLTAMIFSIALCAASVRLIASEVDALKGKVLILAAASTTDAVEELAQDFMRLHPDVTVRTSFAASSTLARQIEAGAEADLFLSASQQWAAVIDKRGLAARQHDLLGNELVIVVPKGSALRIERPADLQQASVRHVALADAASVPAGIYARQALEKLGLWKTLQKKATGAADVRQALQHVESGAAEAGIVYSTDAVASRRVRVVARIDSQLTVPIRYPLMLLANGKANPATVALYEFLASPQAAAVFKRHGFVVLAHSPETRQTRE